MRSTCAPATATAASSSGLAATARVITSAALIMISVFAAFLLIPDVEIKMFGVGLTVAVLVDATVVRMVLVPATMALLGDANWWLPGWLDRLLPHVDVEGSHVLTPAPALRRSPQLDHEVTRRVEDLRTRRDRAAQRSARCTRVVRQPFFTSWRFQRRSSMPRRSSPGRRVGCRRRRC